MLFAVLEKQCGLPIGHNDVFLNIAGGIRVTDPAIDLAIFTALINSLNNIGIGRNVCFAAEIGLTGDQGCEVASNNASRKQTALVLIRYT